MSLWKFVRPFFTNKNCHKNNSAILIDNSKVIFEEHDLVEIFYGHLEKPRNYVSNTNLTIITKCSILDDVATVVDLPLQTAEL